LSPLALSRWQRLDLLHLKEFLDKRQYMNSEKIQKYYTPYLECRNPKTGEIFQLITEIKNNSEKIKPLFKQSRIRKKNENKYT